MTEPGDDEAIERFRLILSQARGRPIYSVTGRLGFGRQTGQEDIAKPGSWVLQNEQLLLLKILWLGCAETARRTIVSRLPALASEANVGTIVHALAELGLHDPLIEFLRKAPGSTEMLAQMWNALGDKLQAESHLFSADQLDALRRVALERHKWAWRETTRVEQLLDRIKYLRLKSELLEESNPEVNSDQVVLVERTEALHLPPAIGDALRKLEGQLRTASTPLDFKACMDLTRSIFENYIRDAARLLESWTHEPLPPGGVFQPWVQYLKNGGLLSENEEPLLQKFYNFLSNEGSHVLASAAEQMRISRVVAIELMLLVSGRLVTRKP